MIALYAPDTYELVASMDMVPPMLDLVDHIDWDSLPFLVDRAIMDVVYPIIALIA